MPSTTNKSASVSSSRKGKGKGGACACTRGGSKASEAVEALMSPAAYTKMEQQLMGGNSALAQTMKDLLSTMQHITHGQAGGSSVSLMKAGGDALRSNAQSLGRLANSALNALTPQGVTQVARLINSNNVLAKGGSILDMMFKAKDKLFGGDPTVSASDRAVVSDFLSQIDNVNKVKIDNLVQQGFVNTSLRQAAPLTGGALAAYQELYPKAQFEEYSVKGIKGGGKQKKSSKSGKSGKSNKSSKKPVSIRVSKYGGADPNTIRPLQGSEWPSAASIERPIYSTALEDMFARRPQFESPEMARIDSRFDSAMSNATADRLRSITANTPSYRFEL